ncbi:MAG: S8 family serine peptidase, partial [Deltaproteobacteria bacterium]
MKRTFLGLMAGMLLLSAGTALRARNDSPRRIPGADFVPHELLVKFKSGTPGFVRKDIHRGASARVLERFSADSRLEHIRLPESENLDSAIAYYSTRADVEYVQKNFIYRPLATPNDALYAGQWALTEMNAPAAWDKSTGRFTVVVALIDTGVDYTHPDLALNIWTNPAEAGLKCTDGVDDDPGTALNGVPFVDDCRGWNFWDFNNDPMDLNGHGTMMAGAIGAMGNDAIGIAGANWDIQIMPLRVTDPSGTSTTDIAIQALDYAIIHGANLVNYSMGAQTSNFDFAFRDAILRSQAAGQLFITAAGNQGADNDVTPFYPCNFSQASTNNPTPPTNIICAASTNTNHGLSSDSNYGTSTV